MIRLRPRPHQVVGLLILTAGLLLLEAKPLIRLANTLVQDGWFGTATFQKTGPYILEDLPAPAQSDPPVGSVIGRIVIPRLQLNISVLEGTGYSQLLVAPGHLPGSVLPGVPGTSVIAAHNATWFRHINLLHVGSRIYVSTDSGRYAFAVTRKEIVRVGTPLRNTRGPSLVLEACYPLDALYLTNQRYWVKTHFLGRISRLPTVAAQQLPAPWPVDLQGTGFTKDQFTVYTLGVPMGSLQDTGGVHSGISQSRFAWRMVSHFLLLYGAALNQMEAGKAVSPGLLGPGHPVPPLARQVWRGVTGISYGSRLDLSLLWKGGRVYGITGTLSRIGLEHPGRILLAGMRFTAVEYRGHLVLQQMQMEAPAPPGS